MKMREGRPVKRGQLRSIAHDLADSLWGGCSLMTGFYVLDLPGDAARSKDGQLTVDLLNGRVVDGDPSPETVAAVSLIPRELDRLCRAADISPGEFQAATACFRARRHGSGFTLTIVDAAGRVTESDYVESPARRARDMDILGRARVRAVRHS